jgi:hypothetical protein
MGRAATGDLVVAGERVGSPVGVVGDAGDVEDQADVAAVAEPLDLLDLALRQGSEREGHRHGALPGERAPDVLDAADVSGRPSP